MKILTSFILLFFITSLCYGEVVYKQGYIHTILDTSSGGSYQEVEINKRIKNISPLILGGFFFSQLKGENIQGVWDYRGTLFVYPIMVGLKYHIGKFYLGGAYGINFMTFSTKEAWVKNRKAFQGIIGYKINNRLGIEVKRLFSDLDIESGVSEYGIMEDRSNLNSWIACLTWRW